MKLKTAAAILALPLLAACAPEIESTVYVGDIVAAAGGEATSVPAILRVPQTSEDSCKQGLTRLITNLGTLAPVSGKGKCIEKDGDQLAEIETEMVIAGPGVAPGGKSLFVMNVEPGSAAQSYALAFTLTRPLEEIVRVLATGSDELQVDFDPAKFTFTFNNDRDGPVGISGNAVFIDDAPALPGTEPVSVARRAAATIVFSDVASVYAEAGNAYEFATVTVAD